MDNAANITKATEAIIELLDPELKNFFNHTGTIHTASISIQLVDGEFEIHSIESHCGATVGTRRPAANLTADEVTCGKCSKKNRRTSVHLFQSDEVPHGDTFDVAFAVEEALGFR